MTDSNSSAWDDDELQPAAPSPGVGGALRRASADTWDHAVRLVPVNVAWGVGYAVALYLLATVQLALFLPIVPILALAWLGIVRLAAAIVRGHPVALVDVGRAWRRWLVLGVAAGLAFGVAFLLLWLNIAIGVAMDGVLGWAIAAFALWALVFLWLYGLVFWPLLVDPEREAGLRSAARLAGVLLLLRPGRMLLVGGIAGVVAVAGTVLFAANLTFAAAWISLFSARLVLPAADELETSLTA